MVAWASSRKGGAARQAVAIAVALVAAGTASAQLGRISEPVLEDVVDVQVIGRDVLAFFAEAGGGGGDGIAIRLEIDEQVLSSGARGRVGAVVTDRRVLAIRPGGASWREERYRLSEAPPREVLLDARIALFVTSARALGFDAKTGNWLERSLGPRERVVAARVGQSSGVVVTDRRALGLSPDSGGFFEANLRVRERVEEVTARANLVTVRTDQRVLVFDGPLGRWSERRLPLNP